MTQIVEKPNLHAVEYRINKQLKIVKDPNGASIRIKGSSTYANLFECSTIDEAIDLISMIESGFLSRYPLLGVASYYKNYRVEIKGRNVIIYNKVGVPIAKVRTNKKDEMTQENIAKYIISLKEEKLS